MHSSEFDFDVITGPSVPQIASRHRNPRAGPKPAPQRSR